VEVARALRRSEPEHVRVELDHRAIGDRAEGVEAARAGPAQEGGFRQALPRAMDREKGPLGVERIWPRTSTKNE